MISLRSPNLHICLYPLELTISRASLTRSLSLQRKYGGPMLFFMDAETEVAERLQILKESSFGCLMPNPVSEDVTHRIVSLLSCVLRNVNPYVQRFMRIGEVSMRDVNYFFRA